MTDANDAEPDPLAPASGRRRRLLLLAVAIVAVAGTAVAIWLSIDRSGPETGQEAAPDPALEDTAPAEPPPGRRYTDEKLGFEEVFQKLTTPRYARFRSEREASEHNSETERHFAEVATGHERERMHFEHNLASVYWKAYDDLPSDLRFGGLLDQAFEEAMDECARARGWPSVQLYGVSNTDVEQYEAGLGLSLGEFLDLRHECAKVAASYPTLDRAVRDELLERLKDHYRAAVYEYLREFPDAEVPLVDHPGAPRPLEERLIGVCLKTSDPAQCAVEFRVELPSG